MNDDKLCGCSVHLVDEELDCRPIYFQHCSKISDSDDIHYINESLRQHLTGHICVFVNQILNLKTPFNQDEAATVYARKRDQRMDLLNSCDSSRFIFNLV